MSSDFARTIKQILTLTSKAGGRRKCDLQFTYIYSFWFNRLATLDRESLKNILVLNANYTYAYSTNSRITQISISHPLGVKLI